MVSKTSCGPGNHCGANPICCSCGINVEEEREKLFSYLSLTALKCPKCATTSDTMANFCYRCGHKLRE